MFHTSGEFLDQLSDYTIQGIPALRIHLRQEVNNCSVRIVTSTAE